MIPRTFHHISALNAPQGAHYDTADDIRERTVPVTEGAANTISSMMEHQPEHARAALDRGEWGDDEILHAPVLDLDFSAFLVPSSTAGHFHLYLDRPVRWADFRDVLEALAKAGIIEPKYAQASIERGRTFVRTPSCPKIPPTPPLPEPAKVLTGKEPF